MEKEDQRIDASLNVVLQVAAMVATLSSIWLSGRKHLWGPIMGALAFVPWSLLAVSTHTYLLVGFNAVVTILNIRTYLLWKKEGPV